MGIFGALDISLSGMDAQARRLQLISSNLANARSTRSEEGHVYRRKDIVLSAVPEPAASRSGTGSWLPSYRVASVGVVEDPRPPKREYQPHHPDADESGFVAYPNIEPLEEMVHMMEAIRTYEANITGFNTTKEMIKKALEIGR